MTNQTVHINGSGELRSMDLEHRQATGEICAFCGIDTGTSESDLTSFGKLVGRDTDVKVCRNCAGQV